MEFAGLLQRHPVYKVLKEQYPERLDTAENECCHILLPEVESLRSDLDLTEDFFDVHVLREQRDEGWFRSAGRRKSSVIVEKDGNGLKLVSAPEYQPSFRQGLHRAKIVESGFGVNKKFQQYKMHVLDRPLLPKYTRAKLTSAETSSRASSAYSSRAPSTVSTNVSTVGTRSKTSGPQQGRPYSTVEQRRGSVSSTASGRPGSRTGLSKSAGAVPKSKKVSSAKSAKSNSSSSSRQWSADSGFGEATSEDAKYCLPPRITSYHESECYLMSLPRCDQFVTHLARNLRPMVAELRFTRREEAKKQIHEFAPRLLRLTQELVIAFPRSASLVNNSPRFQEFLRIAVENVVMRFVHDRIFPVICELSHREDRELLTCANYLHQTKFSTDQLGLPEDFCVPLVAAVIELSTLDMRTTPLDRLTCIYDTVEQIHTHIREAVLEAHADSDEVSVPDDLPSPSDSDMVLLLASVIVRARPMHLMSTLNYADLFAWTVPIDMIEVVSLMSSAADFVRNIQPKKLPPSSGKLKREVSMEEIIQLTDEVQQSYDRQGNRLEPLKSALDLHREKFAQRLEQSSADRAKKQEEAWARLDRCPTPTAPQNGGRHKRGLLSSLHTRLLCSSEPAQVIEVTPPSPVKAIK